MKDLKVGDRVVIHATKVQGGLQAQMVKIGAASAMAGHHHHYRHHKAR